MWCCVERTGQCLTATPYASRSAGPQLDKHEGRGRRSGGDGLDTQPQAQVGMLGPPPIDTTGLNELNAMLSSAGTLTSAVTNWKANSEKTRPGYNKNIGFKKRNAKNMPYTMEGE